MYMLGPRGVVYPYRCMYAMYVTYVTYVMCVL